jgi:hypothetical protein
MEPSPTVTLLKTKMKRVVFFLSTIGMALLMLSSCEKNPSETAQTLKLGYSFGSENSMYQTKSAASDIFDEFYAKLTTGELVADTYNLTFKEVESGAEYSFSGSWKGATVELQAATYKVTGKSTAIGENTQEKCSIYFDETITVTNQMTEIVLNAKYDCYLFVMTSEKLNKVDNCFFFNNKYWYAFVNGNFVNTLTGSHKDGSKFSVEMNDYRFDKGKYYVYYDVSINEYGVGFLIPKMEDGLGGWDGFRIRATSENTVLVLTQLAPQKYSGDLCYSFDTVNWNDWEYNQEIPVELNQSLYLKGNRMSGDTWRIQLKSGSAYGSGYICSLLDNGTDYTTTTIPNQAFQDMFLKEDNITGELRIPDVVKVIGTRDLFGYACYGAWWTSIILPKELEFIGGTAFQGCSMKEITLPKTLQYLGDAVFDGCDLLSTVYFTGTIAEWNAVEKGNYRWTNGGPAATTIICTDGVAAF